MCFGATVCYHFSSENSFFFSSNEVSLALVTVSRTTCRESHFTFAALHFLIKVLMLLTNVIKQRIN